MSNFAPDDFRPFVSGEERLGSAIRAGGYTFSPYWNGMWTAAANFNHLLAFSRKPIIEQHGSATIAWVSNPNKAFASYVVRAPNLHDRKYLRVEVTATTTGGASSFRIYATLEGQLTYISTVTASGGTAVVDVGILDGSIYDVMTLGFTLDFAGDMVVTDVRAYLMPIASSGGGATLDTTRGSQEAFNSTTYMSPVYTPQATAGSQIQYEPDAPLSVAMMSDLAIGLQGMYRDNVGPIINWCWWGDQAAYVTTNAGAAVGTTYSTPTAVNQYIYYPRPGVKYLTAFVAAHVQGYVSNAGKISVNWRGSTTEPTVPISTATTNFLRQNWAVWEYNLDVPDNAGPIFLDVRALGSADGVCVIQSVAIYENADEVV